MTFRLAVATFAAVLTTACSVDQKVESEKRDESYTYDFNDNGCQTGKQTFSAKRAYCDGLLDERRNAGCALALRRKLYLKEDCGPKTWDDAELD